MKLGFDAKRLYNNFTGLGNYSRNLLLNLAEFHPENQYHLYTPKIKPATETDVFVQDGRFTTHLPEGFKFLWRSHGVIRQWQKENLDLFHGLSNEIPYGKSKAKKVVTIHDLIFKVYPHTYKPADRLLYNTKFEYACKKADLVIAISEQTRQDITHYYNIPEENIKVVYQSCHPLFYNLQTKDELAEVQRRLGLPDQFLLSVGSVIERKNLMLIAQAMNLLKNETDIPLLVVGSGGEYMNRVKLYLEQHKLQDRVKWLTGLSSNTDLQALYQLSTAFIYPSVYEGFGIPLVEAMLSGTPVITSNVSCLPETVGESGIIVDPKDPGELANKLRELLSDEMLRAAIAGQSVDFALKKYGRRHLTNQMVDIYASLLRS